MSNIFRTMMAFLGRERDELSSDHEKPFGLTNADIAALRDMRNSDGFEVYMRRLDTVANLYGERLLSSREDAVIHEFRGAIIGLRNAASLVDETIQIHERSADAERVRSGAAGTARDGRAIATFGTPSWQR